MTGGYNKWKDSLAAKEDHSAVDADLVDQEDSIQVQEKCTKQYVQNASKNVKYLSNLQKVDRYYVCNASKARKTAKTASTEKLLN